MAGCNEPFGNVTRKFSGQISNYQFLKKDMQCKVSYLLSLYSLTDNQQSAKQNEMMTMKVSIGMTRM
jgi:hypothetical protein